MEILRVGCRVGYGVLWVGLLLLVESCLDSDNQTSPLETVTPGIETGEPVQSPPVAPGESQELRSLPTAPPYETGTPVYEINPRIRPQVSVTPTLRNTPAPTPPPE